MKFRRFIIFSAITVITISWLAQSMEGKKGTRPSLFSNVEVNADTWLAEKKMKEKALSAKTFVNNKGYNTDRCFFIDMSLPSGSSRFFIYDLKKDSVLKEGLVAHGNCFQNWLEGRQYSNVVGSGCTSLGKYKIGNHYIGKFGYSYKLHGLDKTNDKAFERTVVLHSHSCIPDNEITDEICQSNGCPTVSPSFLENLKKIINNSAKPVLLWIYD